jgi:hypothetical protein
MDFDGLTERLRNYHLQAQEISDRVTDAERGGVQRWTIIRLRSPQIFHTTDPIVRGDVRESVPLTTTQARLIARLEVDGETRLEVPALEFGSTRDCQPTHSDALTFVSYRAEITFPLPFVMPIRVHRWIGNRINTISIRDVELDGVLEEFRGDRSTIKLTFAMSEFTNFDWGCWFTTAQPQTRDRPPQTPISPIPVGCAGCENLYGRSHGGNMLICAIHPHGFDGKDCPDKVDRRDASTLERIDVLVSRPNPYVNFDGEPFGCLGQSDRLPQGSALERINTLVDRPIADEVRARYPHVDFDEAR